MSAARWSLIAAVATMGVWSVNFSCVKFLLETIGPGAFLFFRYLVMPALGFVLLWIAFRRNPRRALPAREDWPRFAACGLVGHTLHVGLVNWGMDLSTPFSSALVLTSGPVFTLLILAGLGAERLRTQQVAATGLALAGIALFLSDKFVAGVSRAGFGDLVLLAAAPFFSLYTVIVRPLTERYGPLIVLAWTLAIGSPPLVLMGIPSVLALDMSVLTPAVWAGLFYAIVISSFFGWLVWTWVNAARGVAETAPLQYLIPPIAGLVAWLTLGERFSGLKIAGAGIAMAGIAWAQFGAGAPAKKVTQPDSG